jgi:hypothetical protein
MTARGGYVTKESDRLFGAKTAGFSIPMQTLLPREKKLSIDRDGHWPGEFAVIAHHRGGALADACIKRALYAPLVQLHFPSNVPNCASSCTV